MNVAELSQALAELNCMEGDFTLAELSTVAILEKF